MTSRDDAKAALEVQRQEKQAEIAALQAQLEEELEDMENLDTAMSGLDSQSSSGDTNVNVNVPVPSVTVDVPETVINVQVPESPAPVVNVEQPVVNVEPAQVTIESTAPDVHVDAHVHPNISLNMPEGSVVTELSGTGIAEAIAASNAMLLGRIEEVRQQLRTVARAANVSVPGLLNNDSDT